MAAGGVLDMEANRYGMLAIELKASFAEIDDETLTDTLEGISDLPDLLKESMRSTLMDEALAEGLKGRLGEMRERLDRLLERSVRKRETILRTMVKAGLLKLMAEDFGISVRRGVSRLEILDETKISEPFLVPQPPRVDRAGLLTALKAGQSVIGAALVEGQFHLQVRVK